MMMVDVGRAFAGGGMVEITTTGRRSGLARRIEIAVHSIDERVYVSGRPGKRDWYANLLARPDLVVHVAGEGGVSVDLPAQARPVTDAGERRRILAPIARSWRVSPESMVAGSPLVELTFVEPMAALSRFGRSRQPSALVEV